MKDFSCPCTALSMAHPVVSINYFLLSVFSKPCTLLCPTSICWYEFLLSGLQQWPPCSLPQKSLFPLYLIEFPLCFLTHTQQKATGAVLRAPQQTHACLAYCQLGKLHFHPALWLLSLYLNFWCKMQSWVKEDGTWSYTLVTALGKLQLEVCSANTGL